jgi:predicted secreted hydrolase
MSLLLRLLTLGLILCHSAQAYAAAPAFARVTPGQAIALPADSGAHPDFRTEWWYVTGWLETPDHKPLGFQLTFFRSATDHDRANPSAFAPKQLIIAHAALSDPGVGKLIHDQKSAREGFGVAWAKTGNTDVKLEDWTLVRQTDGSYRAQVKAREFTLALQFTPTQAPLLEGEQGYSRKGPQPAQASYYYSEPQLTVSGTVARSNGGGTDGSPALRAQAGPGTAVTGHAWLDHEWSSTVLDPAASGWDWLGANLSDGSALMAFQMRDTKGGKLWAHATLRNAAGQITQYPPEQVEFSAQRYWRSPHTQANYPVAQQIRTGSTIWLTLPLQDDQELDSRRSTGAVYWEGAVRLLRNGQSAGAGYLEMTGYVKPLKL